MKLTAVITAAMLFCFALPLQAQWQFGGVLDINLATVNVDPKPSSEDYSTRLVLGIGVVADRPLTDIIDLHAKMFKKHGITTIRNFDALNDVRNHLVYCENGSSVETVIVNGEVMVRDRQLTRVDEEALMDELRDMLHMIKADQ